jgi:hypothetical protein
MTSTPVLTIVQVDPRGPSVSVLLGDGVPTPTGDGGWEAVTRPRQEGFVEWVGTQPISMDVPVMLDGFAAGDSVEPAIALLLTMTRNRQGARSEPPVVRLTGAPVPHQNLLWVISNIGWGDVARRGSDGARIRQVATITFLEYRAPDVLVRRPSPAQRHKKGGSHRTYVVHKGDTLPKIAARLLHNSKRWREIAKLNNLRDPNHLKVGTRLRLP